MFGYESPSYFGDVNGFTLLHVSILSFEQINILFIQVCFVLSLVEIYFAQLFWRRSLNVVNVFSTFCYYLPLKKGWPFV